MTPVLIDAKGLFKLGFYSGSLAVLVFCSGFVFGYQKAERVHLAGTGTELLTIPEVEPESLDDYQPVVPEVVASGADIDVDRPSPDEVNDKLDAESDSGDRVEPVTQSGESASKSGRRADQTSVAQAEHTDDHDGSSNTAIAKQPTGGPVEHIASQTPEARIRTDSVTAAGNFHFPSDFSRVKYSVQVGMYGNAENAHAMVNKLRADTLPAYVYDYINKKQQARYTVRFGFFENRRAALQALDRYKTDLDGDGYLVNFSAQSASGLAVIDQLPVETQVHKPEMTRHQDSTS
jgi:cell division septation protein DedD